MKTNKILAMALAAGMLVSPLANAHAEETANNQPATIENSAADGYATEADAVKAAETALKTDAINNAYDVSQNNGKWFFRLYVKEVDTQPEVKPEKKEVVENNEVGFSTEAKAREAAEAALKSDSVNNAYDVSQNNGKWFFRLFVKEVDTQPEVKPEKDTDKTDKKDKKEQTAEDSFDPDKGYKTKEEAIKAAEKIVAKSKINKGYNITQGADGLYYIQLTPQANKTEGLARKPIGKQAPAKKAPANPKTGIAGVAGVAGVLAAASVAYATSKRD